MYAKIPMRPRSFTPPRDYGADDGDNNNNFSQLRNRSPPNQNFHQAPSNYGNIAADRTMFQAEHLATFSPGDQSDTKLLRPENSVVWLKQLQREAGVSPLPCLIKVEKGQLKIKDRETGEELEAAPLETIERPNYWCPPHSHEAFTNLLLIPVADLSADEDVPGTSGDFRFGRRSYDLSNTRYETHVFRVVDDEASLVSDYLNAKISKAKELDATNHQPVLNGRMAAAPEPMNIQPSPSERFADAYGARNNIVDTKSRSPSDDLLIIDQEIAILNRCLDDVERFVGKLQLASKAFQDVESAQKKRRKKKADQDAVLALRMQVPTNEEFGIVLKKIRLSFNLIALHADRLQSPNAAELLQILFEPLTLIVTACCGASSGGPSPDTLAMIPALTKSPPLTEAACILLHGNLVPPARDLWTSLGAFWTTPGSQCGTFCPAYVPVFSDGFSPTILRPFLIGPCNGQDDTIQTVDDTNRTLPSNMQSGSEIFPSETSIRGMDPYSGDHERREPESSRSPLHLARRDYDLEEDVYPSRKPADMEDRQSQYLSEVRSRGGRVYVALHDKVGANKKELTVQKSEFLEVIDDSRQWWKMRNSVGEEGYVSNTILELYDDDVAVYVARNKAVDPQTFSAIRPTTKASEPKPHSFTDAAHNDPMPRKNKKGDDRRQLAPPAAYSKAFGTELKLKVNSGVTTLRAGLPRSRSDSFRRFQSLNVHSTTSQVTEWLNSKKLSTKSIEILCNKTGEEIFELTREYLENLCGKEEGDKIDSLLTVQKNLCGYEVLKTTELTSVLKRHRLHSESDLPDDESSSTDCILPAGEHDLSLSREMSSQALETSEETELPSVLLNDFGV